MPSPGVHAPLDMTHKLKRFCGLDFDCGWARAVIPLCVALPGSNEHMEHVTESFTEPDTADGRACIGVDRRAWQRHISTAVPLHTPPRRRQPFLAALLSRARKPALYSSLCRRCGPLRWHSPFLPQAKSRRRPRTGPAPASTHLRPRSPGLPSAWPPAARTRPRPTTIPGRESTKPRCLRTPRPSPWRRGAWNHVGRVAAPRLARPSMTSRRPSRPARLSASPRRLSKTAPLQSTILVPLTHLITASCSQHCGHSAC